MFPHGLYKNINRKKKINVGHKYSLCEEADVTVMAPFTFSVVLLQLVQAVEVKVRGGVWQPIQRVGLKAVTQPVGA